MRTERPLLEISEVADCLRRREITSIEATRSQLDPIAPLDTRLKRGALVVAEAGMAAAFADVEIASCHYRGSLLV